MIVNRELAISLWAVLLVALSACAENAPTPNPQLFNSQLFNFSTNSYTNHAGNAVSGVVVALDSRTATISNATETLNLPLSIFPEQEQRRIAAEYVLGHPEAGTTALRVPMAVKRAIAGADKAMARSRKRAEKGLCTKEESEAFCAKSATALRNYLDKQVKEGVITTTERKALGIY